MTANQNTVYLRWYYTYPSHRVLRPYTQPYSFLLIMHHQLEALHPDEVQISHLRVQTTVKCSSFDFIDA